MPYPEGLSLYTIWEEIAHFLDSTKDLLSLALTYRTFKELIVPDYLHYRRLSIDIRMASVWNEFPPEQLNDISHALTTSASCLEGLDVGFDPTTMTRDQEKMKTLSSSSSFVWF
ncbi:hypothetical protein Clacol_010425 [Clathrus columnatus]|uniref:F-box domain-containing protein n=1 Tax=Clathrus columnatus TaxID=1419009 RepID=A0AAV5ATS8_9AGAM|nr:hypothetical protein Clacol_010425 [Clathrus columnatus]